MKCPNCGFDMQEGHLICENCGFEIQIVPDFEPDAEEHIDKEVLDNLIISENPKENIMQSTNPLEDTLEDGPLVDIKLIKNKALTIGVITVVACLLVGIAIGAIFRINSLDNQLNSIRRQAETGKYEKAISSLENLYVTHPENSEILFLEADYYERLSKNDMAIDTLKRIMNDSDVFSEEEVCSAYDKLISIYDSEGNYSAINDLLKSCEYETVLNAYQNYMSKAPQFSLTSGEYDSKSFLRLSSEAEGVIYYTTDGSIPNETSNKYTSPLILETGDCQISAMFVNKYGIASEVVTNSYSVKTDAPDDPIVNADSDSYNKPVLITAQAPDGIKIYYTTDKSLPTEESTQFIDPIPMPVGYSNFTFVCIDEEGNVSNPVVRSYHLTFPDGLSLNNAVTKLKERLIERGMLNDMNGSSNRAEGRFTYEVISAIPISGQGDYYTIREFINDGAGNKNPTDTTYIVEIHQGSTAILGGDAVNGFVAISF